MDSAVTVTPAQLPEVLYCDVVRIRREHAFCVPAGSRLPFTPKGPVFWLR